MPGLDCGGIGREDAEGMEEVLSSIYDSSGKDLFLTYDVMQELEETAEKNYEMATVNGYLELLRERGFVERTEENHGNDEWYLLKEPENIQGEILLRAAEETP